MIIRRHMRGGSPLTKYGNEETAIAAKLRAGVYSVVSVQATCADEYYSPGSYDDLNRVGFSGQKKERHDLCAKLDKEEMEKDPWFAEFRRIAKLHQDMVRLRKADRAQYLKAYSGFMEEIRQSSKTQREAQALRDAEWIAALEEEKKNEHPG